MPKTPGHVGYPTAARLDLVEEMHGVAVADPYRWLEDVDDERTVAWSAAQDELYESARSGWSGRAAFRDRLANLHAVGDVGLPIWREDRAFVLRRSATQDHAVLYAIDTDGGQRTLVDPMAVDPSGSTTLDFYQPSPDGSLLAYGMSEGGTENSVIRVLEVDSGKIVDGPIDRARHSDIAWTPDASAFYYVRHLPEGSVPDDDASLFRRVYKHVVGPDADADTDVLVFGDGAGRSIYFGVALSPDGRWLWVDQVRGTDARNDLYLADLHGSGEFVAVQEDVDAITHLEIGPDGSAYLLTNRDAPRWRLCVADPANLISDGGYSSWRTLIPEDPTAVLNDYVRLTSTALPRALLVALHTRHAIGEVTAYDLSTGVAVHDVALPGVGTVTGLSAQKSGGSDAWFGYTDFTTPTRILRYDARTAGVSVWAEPDGDATTDVAVVTTHVTYPSYDGTEVRMFIAAATDRQEGPAPAILYGYGGFNISRPPVYDPYILAWIEAGGIFALASLRGGSEEGEDWHRDGRRERKQNVFDDFHAAADWLVARGLTTHEQLGIFGGSNGGLLVGTALTQHPEKYAAVVCSAPLLDMVRYEQFGLGNNWNGEYGSALDATEFGWLYAYSPYHHVRPGTRYPAVVFTVFEGDTRVDPLHARKLCAQLQYATSGDRQVLIRRERNVGHASRAVSRTVELAADRLAFFASELDASGR